MARSSDLSEDQLKTKTGELGERLVARYFRSKLCVVEESLDLFDRVQDMTVDGKTCEVKTQQLWHKEQAFTVKPNQMLKCRSVDLLIFVETPSKYNENQVLIYAFPKGKRSTKIRRTGDNRVMHLFHKKNAILLTSISEEYIIQQFNRYSLSKQD